MTDERLIGELLRAVALPDAGPAMERTAAAARGAVAVRRPHTAFRLRIALSFAAAAALVGFSLTPPGRAIADELARLVGIGGPPTVDESTQDITPQAGSNPIVIGEGVVPQGGPRFEIVAYEGQRNERLQAETEQRAAEAEREGHPFPPEVLNQAVGTCVSLDWPDSVDTQGGDFCVDGPQVNPLPNPGHTDYESKLGPGARIAITGLVGASVDGLEVSYVNASGERVQAPVTLAKLDDGLAQQAGATEQFGFYVAFIPPADVGDGGLQAQVMTTVQLTAFDAAGAAVKSLDYGALIAQQIQDSQAQAERLEELRKRAEQNPMPTQTAATCPSIARAFEEAGRSPDGTQIAGRECPSVEHVRKTLERFPEIGTPVKPGG